MLQEKYLKSWSSQLGGVRKGGDQMSKKVEKVSPQQKFLLDNGFSDLVVSKGKPYVYVSDVIGMYETMGGKKVEQRWGVYDKAEERLENYGGNTILENKKSEAAKFKKHWESNHERGRYKVVRVEVRYEA